MAKTMFDKIKKQNGEHFAKAIRNYDNGIFDIPNLDEIVKYAGREAEPILPFLVSLKGIYIEEMSVHQDPVTLLKRAGYNAYVADTLEKQNAIKKYFAPGEELCTFRDPNRYLNYFIINAVREDVDQIHRSAIPQREDAYGTSVISIQVLKAGGFISIKNRYNHTVQNPDNTYNSNPDNIISGLSDAIKHYFGIDFSAQKVILPEDYYLVGKSICKVVNEADGVLYIEDSAYAKDGVIYEIDKNTEILLPVLGAVFNLKKHEFTFLSDIEPSARDRVVREKLSSAIKDKKIKVVKNSTDNTKDIYLNDKLFIRLRNNMESFVSLEGYALYSQKENDIFSDIDWKQYSKDINIEEFSLDAINIDCNSERVHLWDGSFSNSVLDFSHVKDIHLYNVDLSDVVVKFNPNADEIYIDKVTGLKGYLDFGNVKKLTIRVPDSDRGLENVCGINLPKDGTYEIRNDVGEVRDRLDVLVENFKKYANAMESKKERFESATHKIEKLKTIIPTDTNTQGM